MKSVHLFDFIQFDGASWQVVALDGAELALQSLATNRIRRVPVGELLSNDSFLPESPARLPSSNNAAVLERMDADTRAQAEFLHRHVYEVLNGAPPGATPGTAPKPEYVLANALKHRVDAKAAELAAAGTPISKRSLHRHLAGYRKHGIAGPADGRATREASIAGWTDPRVVALLESEIADQATASTGTRSRTAARVRALPEQQGVSVPSRATL